MSVESVKRFYDRLAKNDDLKKEVLEVQEKFKDQDKKKIIEKIIEEVDENHGYDFIYQEFEEYKKAPKELNDDNLEAITGGKKEFVAALVMVTVVSGIFVCVCTITGGGDDV